MSRMIIEVSLIAILVPAYDLIGVSEQLRSQEFSASPSGLHDAMQFILQHAVHDSTVYSATIFIAVNGRPSVEFASYYGVGELLKQHFCKEVRSG